MRSVFKDPDLEKQFSREGFTIQPLLNESEIQKCFELFQQSSNTELSQPFYTSHWSKDEQYRRKIDAALRPLLAPKALQFLNDYKPVYSYFLVKNPGAESFFRIHQDWSQVDEKNFEL